MRSSRCHRWLVAVAAFLLLFSSLPALGQPPLAPAPSPSLLSSDESVRNALREAPLPAQGPSSSPAIPTPAPPPPSANASGVENADDEKHVAIVHEAAALHDAMLDPAAAIIEIGSRSKNGVAVRLRMGRETGEREKDFLPLNAFQTKKKLRNVLPAFPFPSPKKIFNLETKQTIKKN